MDLPPDEELVDENSSSKNWKGIGISLLVIAVVCLLIVIAVLIKKPPKGVHIDQKPFTLDDVLSKNFDPKRFHGSWINDHSFVYQNENLNIVSFDCRSQNEALILSNHTIKQLVGDKFKFFMSSDPNVILFSYDIKTLFRHSLLSRYIIFDTRSNMSYDVVPATMFKTDQIQTALLSPNSRNLAFVYKNNIYLMTKFFDGIKTSFQITYDGEENTIYNGVTDWLYEEEILFTTNAMWWSSNSKKLAYIKFNDSLVKTYTFPFYDGSPYDSQYSIRYPKPDTPNPIANVFVHTLDTQATIKLVIPALYVNIFNEYYIWNVRWLTDDSIVIVYVNRMQTRSLTVINDATTGSILLSKEYPTAPLNNYEGWFVPTGLVTSSRYNYYFQIWPYEGYKISFLLIHEKKVTDANSPPECLTCNDTVRIYYEEPSKNSKSLTSSENCLYHAASFSHSGTYYVLECLGDRVPITYIKHADNTLMNMYMKINERLRELLDSRILVKKSYLRVYLDNATHAFSDAEILYPPNFESAEIMDTIYPVLIFVYNGPSSQTVDFQFRLRKFETFLAVNFGVVVAVIDGRGTDGNGDKFMKAVSKNLGELETHDQIALADALKKETYTDDDKFSIWGWSYGGYLSAMALFKDNSPFKCAVSGAPVVDWLLYDSAYSERFLGSYAENRHAYEKSNLTNFAKINSKSFHHKKLLLIHGTGDDNVHFQNSAILSKYLRTTKIEFDFEVYANVQHTPDDETQLCLYQRISKFLLNCYGLNYQTFYEQLNYHHLVGDPPSFLTRNEEDKE